MLVVRIKSSGLVGFIAGYGPGDNGSPMAIVVVGTQLTALSLGALEVVSAPQKTYRKLRKVTVNKSNSLFRKDVEASA